MAKNKLPYYKMYVDDFDFDEKVLSMSLAEVGLYVLLLNSSWRNGSIPVDSDSLVDLVRRKPTEVKKAWSKVQQCFIANGSPERLVNPRQERERSAAEERSNKASQAGILSSQKRGVKNQQTFNGRSTDVQRSLDVRSTDVQLRAYGSGSVSGSESPEGGGGGNPLYEAYHLLLEAWGDDQRDVDLGAQVWIGLVDNAFVVDLDTVLAGLERWKNSEQWQREDGKYKPSIANWLQQKRWRDSPKPKKEGW